MLLLRFLTRIPEADLHDLELRRAGNYRVAPLVVSCFARREGFEDRSRLGQLLIDGDDVVFLPQRDGDEIDLTALDARIAGLEDHPGRGVVRNGMFQPLLVQTDNGDLHLSVPKRDLRLVREAIDGRTPAAADSPPTD